LGLKQKLEDNFKHAEESLKQRPEIEHAQLNKDIELAKLHKDNAGKDLAGCCARFVDSVSLDRQVLHMKTV
jgi:ribosome assembly protein YihI (activator of Der GTPase)